MTPRMQEVEAKDQEFNVLLSLKPCLTTHEMKVLLCGVKWRFNKVILKEFF